MLAKIFIHLSLGVFLAGFVCAQPQALPGLLLQTSLCLEELKSRRFCNCGPLLDAAEGYKSSVASEIRGMQDFDGSISARWLSRLSEFYTATSGAFQRELLLLQSGLNQTSLGYAISALEGTVREIRQQGYSTRSLRPSLQDVHPLFTSLAPVSLSLGDYRQEDLKSLREAQKILETLVTRSSPDPSRLILGEGDVRLLLQMLEQGRAQEARELLLNALRRK